MTKFNTFYLIVFIVGMALWFMTNLFDQTQSEFYGVAKTKETELNKNYDLAVDEIYVTPGELVRKGQKLLEISRIREEEKLMGQDFEIDKLRADERAWTQSQNSRIQDIENQKQLEVSEIESKIILLETELNRTKSLFEGLSSNDLGDADLTSLENEINGLKEQKALIIQSFDQRIQGASDGVTNDKNPYTAQIKRLRAEKKFLENTKVIKETIVSPQNGRVGTVHCKLGEHVPAFQSLLSIYDQNPTFVLCYVQEDIPNNISVEDEFIIKSANRNKKASYPGKLIAQESRYMPINPRFTRDETVTMWGKEINIQIPENNSFLQGEKIILEHIPKRRVNVSATEVEQASNISN